MIENLAVANASRYLNIASQYNIPNLKAASMDFIILNIKEIVHTNDFIEINSYDP